MLLDPNEKSQLKALEERYVEGVGVVNRPGGNSRPDAACWAVLALQVSGGDGRVIEKARRWLADTQGQDGRVPVSPHNPDAYWPTALAILAWHGTPEYREPQAKALRFLLEFDEINTMAPSEAPQGHDVTIRGWPWIARTHPWVEPTAYAILALRACGQTDHIRMQDGVRLLLDRQLPSGGWNCGNTVTFGLEAKPTAETTGVGLQALAGLASQTSVEKSIAYMQSEMAFLHAPMSLAWAILGLHAWHETVDRPQERILQALARQEKFGPHDTVPLSLLLLAWHCRTGLVDFFEPTDSQDKK
ncbi:MAG: prenyltransferase/squalene oxidase repeat-containing protein [Phycisphaerales bacterium]